MKIILFIVLGLLLYSCYPRVSELRLPNQLAIANDNSIYLGAKKIDIEMSRTLTENRELSDYSSSTYYEKLDNNPFFSHIAYEFSWSTLSSVILSRNADNQDVVMDTSVVALVKIFEQNYGKNYTIYQRNEGLMKIPALCWHIPEKGYVTMYYVPYRVFKYYHARDTFTPNELIVEFSTTKDKWLEKALRYTKSNLGLDALQ